MYLYIYISRCRGSIETSQDTQNTIMVKVFASSKKGVSLMYQYLPKNQWCGADKPDVKLGAEQHVYLCVCSRNE